MPLFNGYVSFRDNLGNFWHYASFGPVFQPAAMPLQARKVPMEAKNTVLIVVDVQARIVTAMSEWAETERKIGMLCSGFRLLELPVLLTEQVPEKLGETIEPLRELLPMVEALPKTTFSCCGSDRLLKEIGALRPRNVILCGIETHVCIYHTAVDLLESGHHVVVAGDAVTSRSREDHDLSLVAVRQAGARVLGVETLLTGLVGDTRHPRFRDILSLIR